MRLHEPDGKKRPHPTNQMRPFVYGLGLAAPDFFGDAFDQCDFRPLLVFGELVVDFAEVQGGVEGSTLHCIELSSIDGDEIEFFATSAVGDRIRIVFYPRTETLVSATPL